MSSPLPHAEDISVAVIEQSGRSENLINPLQATEMDVAVDPGDPHARDIVVLDTPDRRLAKEVIKKPLHDAVLVFRMRGDPFYGIDEWIDSPIKCWLARNVVIPGVDGCIAVSPAHARLFEKKTGIESAPSQIPAYPERWPTTTHSDEELRIVTLTNCVYREKVDPLVDAAPTVEQVLDEQGGHWRICGDGNYEKDLAAAVSDYDYISFLGYQDAHEQLRWGNLMVHLSHLDGTPNATLEAMSSQLPVITNDHHTFVDREWPNAVIKSKDELRAALYEYTNPEMRQSRGERGEQHVREKHNDATIGQDYVRYFRRLLSRDSFERLHGVQHPDAQIKSEP